MTKEKKQFLKYIIWINLMVGIQNFYYYVHNDSLINLTIGALNVGVWVFFRKIAK